MKQIKFDRNFLSKNLSIFLRTWQQLPRMLLQQEHLVYPASLLNLSANFRHDQTTFLLSIYQTTTCPFSFRIQKRESYCVTYLLSANARRCLRQPSSDHFCLLDVLIVIQEGPSCNISQFSTCLTGSCFGSCRASF